MKSVHIITLSLLITSTLFFVIWGAGVFPASVCIVATLTSIAVALCIVKSRYFTNNKQHINIPLVAAFSMSAIILLALSAMPLPRCLDAVGGIRRYEQNDVARETLTEAANLNIIKNSSFRFSITRNRSGTLRILLLAIIMFNAAIMTAILPAKMKNIILYFIIGLGLTISVAGFFHQWIFPSEKTIWWIFKVTHGNPVGCFMNRTHHAGFIAMIMPIALAMFIKAITDRKKLYALAYGTVFLIMTFGVLTALSRGAIIAACAGSVMVFFMTAFRKKAIAAISFSILLSAIVAIIVTLHIHSHPDNTPINNMQRDVTARMATLSDPINTFSGQARISVWKDSIQIWKDYAILGAGANGFRMLFPQYRTRTDRKSFVSAESEYMEILTDTGIIGVLLLCLITWTAFKQWRLNLHDNNVSSHIGIAIAGTATVVFVHNIFDTTLHTPLYAMVFASLIGFGLSTLRANTKPSYPMTINVSRYATATIFAIIGLTIGISFITCGTRAYSRDLSEFTTTDNTDELARTLLWAPTSWMSWCYFGSSLFSNDDRDAYILGEKCISRATDYDQHNYRLWETLAHTRASMGDKEGANNAFAKMQALRPWKKPPNLNIEKY